MSERNREERRESQVYELLNQVKEEEIGGWESEDDIQLSAMQKERILGNCLAAGRLNPGKRRSFGRHLGTSAAIWIGLLVLSAASAAAFAWIRNGNTKEDYLEIPTETQEIEEEHETADPVNADETGTDVMAAEEEATAPAGTLTDGIEGAELSVLSVSRVDRELRFAMEITPDEGTESMEYCAREEYDSSSIKNGGAAASEEEWQSALSERAPMPEAWLGHFLLTVDGVREGEGDFYHEFGDTEIRSLEYDGSSLRLVWIFHMRPETVEGNHEVLLSIEDLSYDRYSHEGRWEYRYSLGENDYPDELQTMEVDLQAECSDVSFLHVTEAALTPNGLKFYGSEKHSLTDDPDSRDTEELRLIAWDDRDNYYVLTGTPRQRSGGGEEAWECVFTPDPMKDEYEETNWFEGKNCREDWDPEAVQVWAAIEKVTDHWESKDKKQWVSADHEMVTEPVVIRLR